MKKILALSLVSIFLVACSKEPQTQPKQDAQETTGNPSTSSSEHKAAEFDANTLPLAAISSNSFPYIQLPNIYTDNGHSLNENSKFYFAINGKPVALEGKLYQVAISNKDNSQSFSDTLMTQSFDEQMEKLGAQKLNAQTIPYELYEKIPDYAEKAETNIGQVTHTYGFKNKEGVPVIAQLTLNSPKITVMELGSKAVELAPLKVDTAPTAATLEKSLETRGKAAVQINFAVNSAKIESSSQNTIHEIVQLLQNDQTLKLSIQGHTDNSGTPETNLKLSNARAQSVKAALIEQNIMADRLESKGLGQTQPLTSNDTDEGKAQNRRVELIKMN